MLGLLHKSQTLLPRVPLKTIYKSFIRSHLDYGDMIYSQTFNMLFQQKMKTAKYKAVLAIKSKRFLQGKNIPRITFGDSSTMTLV